MAKLVNITTITKTYGRYIELVNGIINQLIAGDTTLYNEL